MMRKQPIKMYKLFCSKCGEECEVPFKPVEDKPVYCRRCFNYIKDFGKEETLEKMSEREKFYGNLNEIFSTIFTILIILGIISWIVTIIFLILLFLEWIGII